MIGGGVPVEQPEFRLSPKKYREESVVFSSRVPKDLLRDLDKTAERTGRSRNEVLTLCLEFALKHLIIEESE